MVLVFCFLSFILFSELGRFTLTCVLSNNTLVKMLSFSLRLAAYIFPLSVQAFLASNVVGHYTCSIQVDTSSAAAWSTPL